MHEYGGSMNGNKKRKSRESWKLEGQEMSRCAWTECTRWIEGVVKENAWEVYSHRETVTIIRSCKKKKKRYRYNWIRTELKECRLWDCPSYNTSYNKWNMLMSHKVSWKIEYSWLMLSRKKQCLRHWTEWQRKCKTISRAMALRYT